MIEDINSTEFLNRILQFRWRKCNPPFKCAAER